MESKDLFRALTGEAERLKDSVNKTITVKDVEKVETDKTIAVLKTSDGKLLVSSSRNVVQVVPLLKNMTQQGTLDLFVSAVEIGNGRSTINLKIKE